MNKIKASILTVLVFLILSSTASAAVYYVSPGQSIQTAIDKTYLGDTIFVYPGVYDEPLLIDNKRIYLKSLGDAIIRTTVTNYSHGVSAAIKIYESDVTIDGFTIDCAYNPDDVWLGSLRGIHANGFVSDYYGMQYQDKPVNLILTNNKIINYGEGGISINGPEATAHIENNIVTGRGLPLYDVRAQYGIRPGWGSDCTLIGNTISNHRDPFNTANDYDSTGVFFFYTLPERVNIQEVKSQNVFINNDKDVSVILAESPPQGKMHNVGCENQW